MPPALPVVRVRATGRNAGKTWLARALIEELTRRGFTVGAVKHSHHPLPADKPMSDTDLFASAGADRVVFVASDGVLTRVPGQGGLSEVIDELCGRVDVAIVEGFKADALGAELSIEADTGQATLTAMDGRPIASLARDDAVGFVDAIVREFELAAGGDARLRSMIRRAAAQHGHHCPGVTLGVRMAIAAAAALGISLPAPRRGLQVVMETARCASDAVSAVTSCSSGRRNFAIDERGVMAGVFVDTARGRCVRVQARDDAKERARDFAPAGVSRRHAQSIAYRVMPEELLFVLSGGPHGAATAG